MRIKPLVCATLILPGLLGACANMDPKAETAGIGALIGCAAGAALAELTDNNAAQACAAGAIIGGAIGYQKARNAEIAEAREAAEAAARVKGARSTPVQTEKVKVTDKASGKTETVQAFKSVSVDIPISQIDTAEGKQAMQKLDAYARKMARERGETIYVNVATAPANAAKVGVSKNKVVEKVGKGAIQRSITADTRIPPAVQRVTIEARNAAAIEV